jgi:peptidoglycan hydrolase-like protein with peptidoglycan-binding domain
MKKNVQNNLFGKKGLVIAGSVLAAAGLGYAVYKSYKPVSAADDIRADGNPFLEEGSGNGGEIRKVGGDYMPPNSGSRNGGGSSNNRVPKAPVVRQWQSDVIWPLKRGSSGSRVLEIQRALNAILGSRNKPLVLDGKFGSGTEAALRLANYPISVAESVYNNILAKSRTVAAPLPTKPVKKLVLTPYQKALSLKYKDKEHITPAREIYNAITAPIANFTVVKKHINLKVKNITLITNIARAYQILYGQKLPAALSWSAASKLLLREEINLLKTIV